MGDFGMIERAYVVGLAIAVCAPFIGSFMVMRRYALLSDVLAHVSLLGVAIGLATATAPLIVSVVVVVVAALGLEWLSGRERIGNDVVLALFMSGALALSVIVASFSPKGSYAIVGYLFGSLATIDDGDVALIVMVVLGVMGCVLLCYRSFVWGVFDPEVAQVMGINVALTNRLMVVCAALFIVVSMRLVGGLMMGALLVIPVVAAMNFRVSFPWIIGIGVVFSLVGMVSGVTLSVLYDVPSGAAVVMGLLLIYIVTLGVTKRG